MATPGGISAAARLHAALSRPLYQRCTDIKKLLEDTSTKELHGILPTLVESVFSFGSGPGWGVGRLLRSHGYDFSAVRQLLGPDGPLLTLVHKLLADPFYRYEFPVSCLPFPVQKQIEEGSIPSLLTECVQLNPNGRPYNTLSLNAFEYYFMHFAYYLVNPQQQKSTQWVNPSDALYTVLLEEYLNYFLPPDGRPVAAVTNVAPTIKSPLAQSPRFPSTCLSPLSRSTHIHSPAAGSPLLMHSQHRMNSPYSSPLQSPAPVSMATEPMEAETWRSQVFIQILVEFWLHQTSLEMDKFVYMSPSTSRRRVFTKESFLPSADHVRVVRMLLKHLHYFSNSCHGDVILSPYSNQVGNVWEDFKRSVTPLYVKKKLYGFLKHSFDHWPLDASFRLILETWLSFVQPWRYTDPRQSNRDKESDGKYKSVEDSWVPFIVDHLLFYTALFQCFISRIMRMELTAPKNAYILFRVTKVFGLANLRDRLEEAEQVLYDSVLPPSASIHDLGASFLSPRSPRGHHGNIASTITSQIVELEGPGYKYTPMYCAETAGMVQQLMISIVQSKETSSAAIQSAARSSSGSFLSFLGLASDEYGDGYYDDANAGDAKKLGQHLGQALDNLCAIFQLEPPERKAVTWGSPASPLRPPGPELLTPDVDQTEEGPKLGPLGRYQLMNGLRRFEVDYQGDPDLQPIRSYESAWLVRLLYHLSTYINAKYESQLQKFYHRPDFTGQVAKVVLNGPSSPSSPSTKQHRSLSPEAQRQKIDTLRNPRLSLRWLAQYHVLVSLVLMYCVMRVIFGTGPIGFVVLLMLASVCFTVYRAVMLDKELDRKKDN